MANIVEVYDGNNWVTLGETAGAPGVQDSTWNTQTYDVTQYKNTLFQFRLGFRIGNLIVYSVSSWNVDDVLIANSLCD
jgi:hypothetical protein